MERTDLFSLREKEIFETLKKIKSFKFVIIGGYAVNAYTLPRFSVDCDIVVKDKDELDNVEQELLRLIYKKAYVDKNNASYYGDFEKYEKDLGNGFKVSIDILIKAVLDRYTNSTFSAEWVFNNSEIRELKGKTINEKLKIRIINPEALIVMKISSCRINDIRDVFMLAPYIKDKEWIKQEISKRYEFNERFSKLKEKILSQQFKDGLQGVFGFVDNKVFEKHKKMILELEK